MKAVFALFILAMGQAAVLGETRAKRFAGFGGLSTVGGRVGCVVSENRLFVNGRFNKELSESEQQELTEYKQKLEQFREEVKSFIEERQKQFRQGAMSPRGDQQAALPPRDSDDKQATKQVKKPEPPKKPSFCSDKATTQYVFDGCSVQGDSVYIGDTFVRKLTSDEQEELQQFDKQFTVYQKAVTGQFRKQVENIFGSHFGALFEGGGGSTHGSSASNSKSTEIASGDGPKDSKDKDPAATAATPEAPKTPNFCTLIV